MATLAATPKSRKTATRFARLFDYGTSLVLGITDSRDTVFYGLEALPSDFGRAFRLTKAERGNGPEESYDVCLQDGGRSTCECKGHLQHGHRTVCKHVASLLELEQRGLLPVPAAKPQPAPARLTGENPNAGNGFTTELDDL